MVALSVREFKGLEIAARSRGISQKGDRWVVPSQTGLSKRYTVGKVNGAECCTCPDFETTGLPCKHIFAIRYVAEREQEPKKRLPPIHSVEVEKKPTYRQDWPAYNKAQCNEKHDFQIMLRDLCADIKEPEYKGRGRRPLLLADLIFSAVFKIYSTVSCRRFMTDLKEAQANGYISQHPHYNSVFNCLESEDTHEVLGKILTQSSLPLRTIETKIAADSSGFSSCRFVRWYDEKYGKERKEHEWVKVHIMCGAKTNVITAAVVGEKYSADCPLFPELFEATVKNFKPTGVCADLAYSSNENIELLYEHDVFPYIPFKTNTVERPKSQKIWDRLFHYFCYSRDEFLEHYHQRSNVESTFSMIKAKFGDSIRSRTDVAMKNEVMCKMICHNICCVIQTMYEMRLDLAMWRTAKILPAETQTA